MIHILLLILKIIGILLLVILGLVVLLLLVPIRYAGKGNVAENHLVYSIKAGWLFRFLYFDVKGNDGEGLATFRVLGIPIKKIKIPAEKKANTGEEQIKETEQKKSSGEERVQDSKSKEKNKKETEKDENPEEEQMESQKATFKDNAGSEEKKSLIKKIKELINRIKDKIQNITRKTQGFINKIVEVKRFITAKSTKRAYNYGKNIIIKLLRHIRPRKIKANVTFGMGEPDGTGKILGYLAIIFPVLRMNPKRIQIYPDFQKKIIEGDVMLKGHIILGVVIIYALKFYFNKDIHGIIKKFS